MRLNIPALLDFCCGVDHPEAHTQSDKIHLLAKELNDGGFESIEPMSIKKWIERKSIPSDRLVDLVVLSARQGKKLFLHDFILGLEDKDRLALIL